jgi:hypothetical protein
MSKENKSVEDREVEWPDSEDTSHVERLDVYRSEAIFFTHQQLCDKECTEEKEDGNPEVAKQADVIEPEVLGRIDGQVIHTMNRKNAEKGEKTQSVQLGTVIACDIHSTYIRVSERHPEELAD